MLIDLMRRGFVSALAMNGAGIIHDFEIALSGGTSEDVDESLGPGRFGMAEETGRLLNDIIRRASAAGEGIGQAVGRRAGGNSLDNTLRVARRVPTDWVLADVRVHAVADGFGHGLVHLWAEDGTLLGTASQSAIVRYWKDR